MLNLHNITEGRTGCSAIDCSDYIEKKETRITAAIKSKSARCSVILISETGSSSSTSGKLSWLGFVWDNAQVGQHDIHSVTAEFQRCFHEGYNFNISGTDQSNIQTTDIEVQRCLNKIYNLQASDVELLDCAFELVENAFAEQNLLLVNNLLDSFEPTRTKIIVSTGILRATSRAKRKLNAWRSCFVRVSEHLSKQGENPKKLLRGLIRADDSIAISTTTLS